MKLAARLLLITFFIFVFFFSGKGISFAQTVSSAPTYQKPTYDLNTAPGVPNNLHTLTQSVFIEVASTLICQLAGFDPTNPTAKCLGMDPKTGKIGYVQNGGGAIGLASLGIASTLQPPLHTGDYVRYLSSNFGVAKGAYAADYKCDPTTQGEGFCGLQPLVKIWTTFRDIAYLLFVLIFLIIGFGIMFRLKINANAVMAVENQIPKLIITILLVTFSFAVAGLLIDVMWIITYLFIGILAPIDPANNINIAQVNQHLFDNPVGFFGNLYPGGIVDIAAKGGSNLSNIIHSVLSPDTVHNQLGLPVSNNTCNDIFCGIGNIVVGVVQTLSNLVGSIFAWIVTWVVGILAFLILFIALFVALMRLWFALIMAYIFIIMDVIFAPFWIMGGLVPGGGDSVGFGAWFRDIFSNLAVFPATIMMFLLAKIILDSFSQVSGSQFIPPLVSPSGEISYIGPITVFGILLAMPHMLQSTRAALKAPKISLPPITEPLGAGAGVTRKAIGAPWSYLTHKADKEGGHSGVLRLAYERKVARPVRERVDSLFHATDLRKDEEPGHRIAVQNPQGQSTGSVGDSHTRAPIEGSTATSPTASTTPPPTPVGQIILPGGGSKTVNKP